MSNKRIKSMNELEGPATEVPVELPQRHVLEKCPGCKRIIDADELERGLDVCPRCGHHLRVSGRQRMRITVDEGSFIEWDANLAVQDFLQFPGYAEKLASAREATGEPDAVVCGQATIGGHACACFFMNADFMMGSMGSVVGEKLARCFEQAAELRLPVVGFTVSGGARMQEGTTSLMQMAKVSAAVRRHGEAGLLYITVLTDPTTGGVTASFAMEGDVILAEPGALVAFAGPRVIEQTTHKRLPAGFQRSEFILEHGFCDMIVDRRDMRATLSELLALHEGAAPDAEASGLTVPHALVHDERPRRRDRKRKVTSPADQSAYDVVRAIRSTNRTSALELMELGLDGFVELHGDRLYGDDGAIVGGIGWKDGRVMTVIAIERGRSTKERVARNFGMAHPEGYRKALRLMRQAQKFGRPVVCLVDTSGAYCGIGAEERGQGEAIATNLVEMSGLTTPIVSVVVGEGGSGGALALAVADRVLMLGSAAYSVVSPEGCASILWKDTDRAGDAAEALHITASDLMELGIIDGIVPDEGVTPAELAADLMREVGKSLDDLEGLSSDDLVGRRYDKFRAMGSGNLCSL